MMILPAPQHGYLPDLDLDPSNSGLCFSSIYVGPILSLPPNPGRSDEEAPGLPVPLKARRSTARIGRWR